MIKKYLTLAALIIAIASYGGITVANAQTAQSLTPAERAAAQQSLDVLKAKLINLQMQQGVVPAGDDAISNNTAVSAAAPVAVATPTVASPATSLSASEVASLNNALTAFATTLQVLQTRIAQDPNFLSANQQSVMASLQGIATTLASIGTEVSNANIAATHPSQPGNIAQANPGTSRSAGSAAQTGGTTVAPSTQSNETTPAPAATTPTNAAPQTASAFSFSKLNWPLIVVIILIVAAIAIWLFWDTEETKPAVKTVATAPQKPMQPFTPPQPVNNSGTPSGGQPPLSATMNPQQRKSA